MGRAVRSNAPQALSVAAVTEPGNVRLTVDRILEFDDARIGFTHAPTWSAMAAARRGVINPTSDHIVFAGTHPRVERCIRALCALGKRAPVETHRFSDHPESGLRAVNDIEWGPGVTLKVKGVCWYNWQETPIIPLLQPRKTSLSDERMALYAYLGRQAFLKGDWHNGRIEVIDLSGDDRDGAYAQQIAEHDIPPLTSDKVAEYVATFIAAKAEVAEIRASKPKPRPKPKGDDLFGSDGKV